MGLFSRIAALFRRAPGVPPTQQVDAAAERFVYVMIPEHIGPLARGEKYEEPIEAKLLKAGLGEVTGAGSALGDERPDGTRAVEFCGIDVDVTELDPALALLRELLPALGAPDGTELHYTRGGARLLDGLAGGRWAVRRHREMVHPGFGF
ncbi:MAG: hypothetical protein QM767_16750 [Anaeromyxobacter sp.]